MFIVYSIFHYYIEVSINVKIPIYKFREIDIMIDMTFREWLWDKFDEWRKGTTRGITEFAAFLGVGQSSVTGWLKGDFLPSSKSIKKISEKYPDVYEAFGGSADLSFTGLPGDFTREVGLLLEKIRVAIESKGVTPESPEALKISNEILDDFVSRRKTNS
jgi:hypothetical protein